MNDSAAVPSAASSQFGGGTVTRQEVHMRRVEMRGYARSDGLFEVEGRVIDTKSRDFNAPTGSRSVRANEPIHDMGVRLIFDEDAYFSPSWTVVSADRGRHFRRTWTLFQADRGRRFSLIVDD